MVAMIPDMPGSGSGPDLPGSDIGDNNSNILTNVTKVQVTNTILSYNSSSAVKVNCNNVHWVNNSASLAFANFSSLTDVSNIGNTVTDIGGICYNCYHLVNAPTIPSSVTTVTKVIDTKTYYAFQLDKPFYYDTQINTLYFLTNMLGEGYIDAYYYDGDFDEMQQLWSVQCYIVGFMGNNTFNITLDGESYSMTRDSFSDKDMQLYPYDYEYCGAFASCASLVNMPTIQSGVQNISYMFHNCLHLTNLTTIPNSVTSMANTFSSCIRLTNMPTLPNSVVNLDDTFIHCSNLVNTTSIPNGVINMSNTFEACYNLETVPALPNSVVNAHQTFSMCNKLDLPSSYTLSNTNITDAVCLFWNCFNLHNAPALPNTLNYMGSTFGHCTNITTAPNIPASVTNMYGTFDSCTNLTGDIYIYSENIANAQKCFNNTSTTKNVYIPFQNGGVNTKTYNSFTSAGYKTDGSVGGVYLKNINNI